MSSIPPSEPPPIRVALRIPAGEVARSALVLLGIGLGALLLYELRDVVVLVLLAILFATAIEPIVKRLRRGPFSRGTGALVVYVGILLVIAIPVVLIAPNLVAQTASFTQDLPDRLAILHTSA